MPIVLNDIFIELVKASILKNKLTMKTLALILLLSTISQSSGLKCYVCSKSASDASDLCINNPGAVSTGSPTVNCGAKYCTIKRQEYKDPAGRVASFYRGCENNPIHLNTMVEDADFKTYFRACTGDLCNTGNGIQHVNNGNLGNGGNTLGNLLVPGIGTSDGHSFKPNFITMTIMIFLTILISFSI